MDMQAAQNQQLQFEPIHSSLPRLEKRQMMGPGMMGPGMMGPMGDHDIHGGGFMNDGGMIPKVKNKPLSIFY